MSIAICCGTSSFVCLRVCPKAYDLHARHTRRQISLCEISLVNLASAFALTLGIVPENMVSISVLAGDGLSENLERVCI